jgi:hypothetical protein
MIVLRYAHDLLGPLPGFGKAVLLGDLLRRKRFGTFVFHPRYLPFLRVVIGPVGVGR